MSIITGLFTLQRKLQESEKPAMVETLLRDDIKRFIGDIIVSCDYRALMIDLRPIVFNQPTRILSQQVLVAKTRPLETNLDEYLFVSGSSAPYRLYDGRVFDLIPAVGKEIYRRIG